MRELISFTEVPNPSKQRNQVHSDTSLPLSPKKGISDCSSPRANSMKSSQLLQPKPKGQLSEVFIVALAQGRPPDVVILLAFDVRSVIKSIGTTGTMFAKSVFGFKVYNLEAAQVLLKVITCSQLRLKLTQIGELLQKYSSACQIQQFEPAKNEMGKSIIIYLQKQYAENQNVK